MYNVNMYFKAIRDVVLDIKKAFDSIWDNGLHTLKN